jgi:cytochrome P450
MTRKPSRSDIECLFCRTALERIELRGRTIEPGDFVVKVLPSGNRDDDVWEWPDEYDVERKFRVPQMTFGWGQHHCPG